METKSKRSDSWKLLVKDKSRTTTQMSTFQIQYFICHSMFSPKLFNGRFQIELQKKKKRKDRKLERKKETYCIYLR